MSFLKNISSHPASDAELVAAFRKSGDLNLLAALYQRYMDLVFGVCVKYLKEAETARDATMLIFEELAQKLPKYEVDNFRSWLYTLAKNHCLMQLRSSSKVRIQEFDPEGMQSHEDPHLNGVWEKEDKLNRLSKCLETLSPEQKTAVELFYLEGKCYKEIEKLTGQEWNKVRSNIQNGRRNLKICIDKQEPESVEKIK